MRSRQIVVACTLAASALVVSACSSGGPRAIALATPSGSSITRAGGASLLGGSTASGGTTCRLYAAGQPNNNGRGGDVQVATQGGQSCNSWLESLASGGLNWSNGADPSFDSTDPGNPNTNYNGSWQPFNRDCELSSGGGVLTVFDDGTPSGSQICSQYESTGWTPYTPTTAAAQASASAAAAQVSAQASAVASQQVQQAAAGAAQTLPGYISTLQQDTQTLTSNSPTTGGALPVFASDVANLKNDLSNVQNDYQALQDNVQSNCMDGPVGGAEGQLQGDVSQTDSDLQQLQGDINQSEHSVINPNFTGTGVLEQDIANIETDLTALRKVGQSPPEDPSQAITAAQAAINTVNAAAASAQQQGATIDTKAHQIGTEGQQLASKSSC
jgi:hypothetical protein